MTFLKYLGLAFAFVYILFGAYFLLSPFIFPSAATIPNANIFGILLVAYGAFRIYRHFTKK
ncbi:MAG: hypothetical protein SFY32_04580 [Bacteroidota bacterium]|nr:hypothetical protein [Bacteroidota bacterium]